MSQILAIRDQKCYIRDIMSGTIGYIGQVPVVESYLDRLAKVIFEPLKRGQSAIFIWPGGAAKSFFLSQIFSPKLSKLNLGKFSQVQEIIYFDLHKDFLGTSDSFIDFFKKQLPLEKLEKLIEEKEVILVLNKLENYSTPEIGKISRFLSKIASLNPYRIHFSLHLTFNKDLKKYLTGLGKIANLTGPLTIPLPTVQESQEILTNLARQNNLNLSPKQIKEIVSQTGSHVVLIRAAIREILGNKNLLKNVSLVSKTPGFNLKLKALNDTLPQNLQRKTDNELSVKNRGEISDLSKTQEKILEAFIQKKNNILLRDDIAQIIWGENSFDKFSDWAINKTVSRLRSKLIAHGYPSEILTTIKGRGYQYVS